MRCLLAIVLASAACRPIQRPTALSVPRPPPPKPTLEKVAEVRGLPAHHSVEIVVLDDARYEAVRSAASANAELARRDYIRYTVFGFDRPRQGLQKPPRTMVRLSMGFAESSGERVFIRHTPSDELGEAVSTAHELEHAIQAQNFGPVERRSFSDDDPWLAASALLEGDATLTTLAFRAVAQGLPVRPVLFDVNIRSDQFEKPTDATDLGSELANQMVSFRYFAGFRFALELFRSGGFALLNRAFVNSPMSTEQVLHPDKYIAGEMPARIAIPEGFIPTGHHVIDRGTLGELAARVLLSSCNTGVQDPGLGAVWAGDAFLISQNDAGELQLVWVSVWDDEKAASRYAELLTRAAACSEDGRPPGPHPVSAGHLVSRADRSVILVRGYDAKWRQNVVAQLPSVEISQPEPRSMLSDVVLAPTGAQPQDTFEYWQPIKGHTYSNPALGVTAALPPGFEPRTRTLNFDLIIKRERPFAMGGFVHARGVRDTTAIFDSTGGWLKNFGIPQVTRSSYGVGVAWGEGRDSQWTLGANHRHARELLMHDCVDGTFVFFELWEDDESKQALDDWVKSFKPSGIPEAPACVIGTGPR